MLRLKNERWMINIYGKIIGIVAEYNPLHNGHLHHIEKSREIIGADAVVAVLSSYFTQRGEPALISKWDRTEMAIRAGVNLVLELPVFFSCHNAGVFASGAVDILAATGLVNNLSFGMEHPDFNVAPILDILVHEPQHFKDNLKKSLNSGSSYVKARATALSQINEDYGEFISAPNNSLGLAYMERIHKKKYNIECIPIQRRGSFYHEKNIDSPLASAAAIRTTLRAGNIEKAKRALPLSSMEILDRCFHAGRIVLSDDVLWRTTRFLILRTLPDEIAQSSEMTEGMENRLLRFVSDSSSWEGFVAKCVTGRYPRGRIQRQLIHFLLGINHGENRAIQKEGPAYIRVLGADECGIAMLRSMRKTATLPVFSKTPHCTGKTGKKIASLELTATALWENLTVAIHAGSERKRHCSFTEQYSPVTENVLGDDEILQEAPYREPLPRIDKFPSRHDLKGRSIEPQ